MYQLWSKSYKPYLFLNHPTKNDEYKGYYGVGLMTLSDGRRGQELETLGMNGNYSRDFKTREFMNLILILLSKWNF